MRGRAERSRRLRAFYAPLVAGRAGAADPRIEQAFAAVPRKPFAGPGPWSVLNLGTWSLRRPQRRYIRTPDDDAAFLYQDKLIALDAERGINIGEPSLPAHCLSHLTPQPGETVLQIGAGSAYDTAIPAALVGADHLPGRLHQLRRAAGRGNRARARSRLRCRRLGLGPRPSAG